jgi:hypothetical protein
LTPHSARPTEIQDGTWDTNGTSRDEDTNGSFREGEEGIEGKEEDGRGARATRESQAGSRVTVTVTWRTRIEMILERIRTRRMAKGRLTVMSMRMAMTMR